jgi:hypothetical protein
VIKTFQWLWREVANRTGRRRKSLLCHGLRFAPQSIERLEDRTLLSYLEVVSVNGTAHLEHDYVVVDTNDTVFDDGPINVNLSLGGFPGRDLYSVSSNDREVGIEVKSDGDGGGWSTQSYSKALLDLYYNTRPEDIDPDSSFNSVDAHFLANASVDTALVIRPSDGEADGNIVFLKVNIDKAQEGLGQAIASVNGFTESGVYPVRVGDVIDLSVGTYAELLGDKYTLKTHYLGLAAITIELLPNTTPVLVNAISDQNSNRDLAFLFTFEMSTFFDPDVSDSLTYEATKSDGTALPGWLSFDSATRTFSGTPTTEDIGTLSITVTATDTSNARVNDTFDIVVSNFNSAPADISLSSDAVAEHSVANATIGDLAASDPDSGDTFTFTLVSGVGDTDNASVAIVGNTLTVVTSTDFETKNSYAIRVQVADQDGLTFQKQFTITVTDVNETPTITGIANQTILEDIATSNLAFSIDDPEEPAGNLSLTATSSNIGLIPNANIVMNGTGTNRNVIVTPAANQSGTATITLTVNDGTLFAIQTFQVTVLAVDDPPVIALNPLPLVRVIAKKVAAIDGAVTLLDIDSPTLMFNGAVLQVSGLAVKDTVSILKQNGIARKGKNVVSGKTVIGALSGGKKGVPLKLVFNGAATLSSVQSLLRSIGFKSVDKIAGNRTIQLQITNIDGTNTNQATRQIQVGE